MSRIGRKSITVPQGVEVKLEGTTLKVKGAKGELKREIPSEIQLKIEGGQISVSRNSDEPRVRALHGLLRADIANMIQGTSKGFEKRLEVIGVGYRFQIAGSKITLSLGFSHPIEMTAPAGIKMEADKENKNLLIITGIDRQLLGQFAANIRAFKKPEPYKGKGIKYVGEYIQRKAGKAAAKEAK